MKYPKRLIEVDLPIARISAHSRREKSIRHGHISTLHIWWARRPLAACRAVICASLWPDPADELCPPAFREAAVEQIKQFANRVFPKKITEEGRLLSSEKHLSSESRGRWEAIAAETLALDANEPTDMPILRMCMLDFIADFANWDNSTVPAYLETSRALTQAAHEALGGVPGTRPLVVDPFAGGGSIPLEALRVGADAFASDLNPVPVLLNKVTLNYLPRYRESLSELFRESADWVKMRAAAKMSKYYSRRSEDERPIAYLWARTVQCEGPSCGAKIPMVRSMWLSRKKPRTVALQLDYSSGDGTPQISLMRSPSPKSVAPGTNQRSSATCPCCGFTTPRVRIVEQAASGVIGQMLLAVVIRDAAGKKHYHEPTDLDLATYKKADAAMRKLERADPTRYRLNEELPYLRSIFNVRVYAIDEWGKLFNSRQRLALFAFSDVVAYELDEKLRADKVDADLAAAVRVLLAFCVDRIADYLSSICRWDLDQERTLNTFCRQALGMVWDYAETVPFAWTVGSWDSMKESILRVLQRNLLPNGGNGTVVQGSAVDPLLPNDSAQVLFTDPPYYDAVPYANLSDFFLVWLKRSLPDVNLGELEHGLAPKSREAVQLAERNTLYAHKTKCFFEEQMTAALTQGRLEVASSGIGTFVFAHKETSSWEAMLSAVINAGWVTTASWPIDTEQAQRLRAQNSAALASSVHIVCRPRENPDGSLREEIGEWRDVLSELPNRIHEWMPRLADEGVVGADAIFACLGPALEIFSRYSRVEKASGESVPLREYLEQVWAAVSTEALSMIFEDADAAGLEPDARLTAMWLWTLGAGDDKLNENGAEDKVTASTGYTLEYDAARKIAQGLGINLEKSESIVEVKAGKARLLPCSERTRHLFGKEDATATSARGRKKKKEQQRSLFEELDELEAEAETAQGELKPQAGETVLDRVHQSMILFASGRGEALRRFLVEDGAGTDARFWKLAQSLSALYPKDTDEKRWVDGVLARKKGLGL